MTDIIISKTSKFKVSKDEMQIFLTATNLIDPTLSNVVVDSIRSESNGIAVEFTYEETIST